MVILKGFRKETDSLGNQSRETKSFQKSNAFKDLPQRRWQTQGRLALGGSTAVLDFRYWSAYYTSALFRAKPMRERIPAGVPSCF